MFICGTAKKYERHRFCIGLGKQFPDKNVAWSVNLVTICCSRMLILLGRRHQQPAGRRVGSEIAANGPKTQRQTGQERSGKRLGGRGPKPIFEAIMGHASSRGEEGEEKRVGMKVTANDIKCSGKRQAKIAANGQKPQRQTKKTIGSE